MERGLRALKRWKQSQSEEKSAVGNFPTHMLKRVGNSPTMAVPRTAKTEGRVGNFPTPFLRNGRNPSNLVVGDFPTHKAVPAGRDRKSVEQGKSVSVRVDLGGRRIIKEQKKSRT